MSSNVPLPAGTTLGKSFEYGIDVNLGTEGSPQWQSVRRLSGWAPTYPKTTEATTSYDDLGASNEDVTGRGFAGAFTVLMNRNETSGMYLPEIEKILAASKGKGAFAVIEVRWYHKPEIGAPNPNDAGQAFVTVDASRQNTGDAQNEVLSVTLTGKGQFTQIENPFPGWDVVTPRIASVTPAGASAGDIVVISGTSLMGATAVKFGTADAAEFLIVSHGSIAATLPAGSAGSAAVSVVTPGGTSNSFPYTRAV